MTAEHITHIAVHNEKKSRAQANLQENRVKRNAGAP